LARPRDAALDQAGEVALVGDALAVAFELAPHATLERGQLRDDRGAGVGQDAARVLPIEATAQGLDAHPLAPEPPPEDALEPRGEIVEALGVFEQRPPRLPEPGLEVPDGARATVEPVADRAPQPVAELREMLPP